MKTLIHRLVAALGAVMLTLGIVLALSAPAQAHAALVSSDPEDGASLAILPATITLTFSEDMRDPAYVAVTGPDGDVVTGDPTIDGTEVAQAVDTAAAAGDYTISYRVVSSDGHPVTGTLSLQVTEGGAATGSTTSGSADSDATAGSDTLEQEGEAAASSSTSDTSQSWWDRHADHVFLFGGLAVVAGALLFLALRRSSS